MINLVNDLYLDADKLQFILKEKSVVKDKDSKRFGEETFRTLGFYPSVSQLLESSVVRELRSQDFDSLKEMEAELKRLSNVVQVNISKLDFDSLKKELKVLNEQEEKIRRANYN